MKKLYMYLISLMICLSISCCINKHTEKETTYSVSITNVLNMSIDTLTSILLDSVINTDKLPIYSKWNKSYLKDGDTNITYEYSTIYDNETGIIYTVKLLKNKNYVLQKKQTTSK